MSDASRVLQMLSERRYAMKIDVVAKWAGLSRRETEGAIEALRLEGQPIVGGNEGVQLTRDPRVVREYVKSRRRRLFHVALEVRKAWQNGARAADLATAYGCHVRSIYRAIHRAGAPSWDITVGPYRAKFQLEGDIPVQVTPWVPA